MNRNNSVPIARGMLMVLTLLAFATASTKAADIQNLRRIVTAAGQELDNVLSATKSIEDLLVSTQAGLLSRKANLTRAVIPSAKLLITLHFVDGLHARLDRLSKDTARTADVLASISRDVEVTGDDALIDAYSNVKRQVVVVHDAIRRARILAFDITTLIRRMLASTDSDSTDRRTRTFN